MMEKRGEEGGGGGVLCRFLSRISSLVYSLSECVTYSTNASRFSRICYTGQLTNSQNGRFFLPPSLWSSVIPCLSTSSSPVWFLNSHLEYSFKTTAKGLNWNHALPASCLLKAAAGEPCKSSYAWGELCKHWLKAVGSRGRLNTLLFSPSLSFPPSFLLLPLLVGLISFRSELDLQPGKGNMQPQFQVRKVRVWWLAGLYPVFQQPGAGC